MLKPLLPILLFFPFSVYAQNNNTIEQYCELTIKPASLFTKQKITIDFGNGQLNDLNQPLVDSVRKQQSTIQILNSLAKHGWKLVTHTLPRDNNTSDYYYHTFFLKKEIPVSN